MLRRPTHRATTASASFSSAAGAPNLAILPSAAGTSNAIGAPRLVPSAAGALKLVPSAAGAPTDNLDCRRPRIRGIRHGRLPRDHDAVGVLAHAIDRLLREARGLHVGNEGLGVFGHRRRRAFRIPDG